MPFRAPGPAGVDDTIRAVEVHYFRIDHRRWELMLLRAIQTGANTISTYIPWSCHAPAPGVIDLTGRTHPRRNLVGFLDLIARFDLGLIFKPGPFVDSEILGGGIPPWFLESRPDLWARTFDDRVYRHTDSMDPRLSYDAPDYHRLAAEWFAELVPLVEQHRDRLVAVQVDNETPGDGFLIHEDSEAPSPLRADYASPQRFDAWLKDTNRGGRVFASEWAAPTTEDALRDWAAIDDFAESQLRSGLAAFAKSLRSITPAEVPLFHDWLCMPWTMSGMLIEPATMAETCGWIGQNVYAEDVDSDSMIAGTSWYRMNFEEYVHHAWWRTRLAHTLSPAGYPHLVPEISARQQFYLHCHLIGGMDAPCVYVLAASSPEPDDVGAGFRWAGEAPLTAEGAPRPQWANARTLFAALTAGGRDLAASPLPAPVAIAYDHAGERFARFAGVIPGSPWPETAVRSVAEGANTGLASNLVAQALVAAGVDFDVVDAGRADLTKYDTVVVPDVSVMSRAGQDALAACVDRGGSVVSAGLAPAYDEDLQPYTAMPFIATLDIEALVSRLDDAGLRSAVVSADGVDASMRRGEQADYLTVVNRRNTQWTGEVHVRDFGAVSVSVGAASVTWARLRGGVVDAALVSGADAAVGSLMCSQGQASIVDFGDGYEVVVSERCVVTIPGAAGASVARMTISGDVVECEPADAAGRIHCVANDDQGFTDRYVIGDPVRVKAWTAHVHEYLAATWEAAEQEMDALAVSIDQVDDDDLVDLRVRLRARDAEGLGRSLPRLRSRLAAGSAAPGTEYVAHELGGIVMRLHDMSLDRT